MRFMKVCVLFVSVVFALNIAACCGGGTTVQEKQTQVISQPTVGDQLDDLDKAYKNGAITKEEYDKLKKDIMNKAAQPQPK
ncbi:MAG TPA: SHOCT domain-containing protein [Syntrophales bacterium]|nr:SHOCT domain-containing protein [Syntrophales bacterium]